jgi:hypothetical protein
MQTQIDELKKAAKPRPTERLTIVEKGKDVDSPVNAPVDLTKMAKEHPEEFAAAMIKFSQTLPQQLIGRKS